ncbi:MAG TPA: GNAT family N-acetyltransferase, partial [Methanobacterium sp.]
NKVSELIYETELDVFKPLLGEDKNKALENIEKLVKSENNLFGHENIHVVSDENGNVLAILLSFCGRETNLWADFKAFFKILNFIEFLELMVKGIAINELLTSEVGPDDYYLSNIAVDPLYRGQGIGTYILENAFKLAEDKGCRRVILDVKLGNEGALKLYEKFGFKVYGKKNPKLIFKGQGTYNMEHFV